MDCRKEVPVFVPVPNNNDFSPPFWLYAGYDLIILSKKKKILLKINYIIRMSLESTTTPLSIALLFWKILFK